MQSVRPVIYIEEPQTFSRSLPVPLSSMRTLLLLASLLGVVCANAQAQTIWSRPYEPNQIALEAFVPELPDENTSGLSGATFLTATHSLNENVELAAELPMARYAGANASTTGIGNPYVGVGLSSTRTPILLEIGARIPAVPSNRTRTAGRHADPGRTAAFRDEAFSVSALLNGRLSLGRQTTLRLRSGLTYAPTADSTDERSWRIPYSAQIWWDREQFMTGLSVVGRPVIGESPFSEGQSTHRAVLSFMLDGARLKPGLLVGTGLDSLFNEGHIMVLGGATLSISYNR